MRRYPYQVRRYPYRQVGWNRAARTDKGVSAAGNVVSLKMVIGFPDIIARINAELPPQARAPNHLVWPSSLCNLVSTV